MVGSKSGTQFGDTTHTKIFVGGLPWVTQTDTVKDYFERFGEILEAVVIADKITGRSKGYGFVTFKDPDSAVRACQNPCPVIDGRRANCNLAVLGAHKNHPNTPQPQREVEGMKKFRASNRAIAPIPFLNTSAYFLQQNSQYAFPYSAYGYPLYQQDNFAMSYYNVYGGGGQGHQQYPNYALQGSPGLYYYPWYFCPILLQPQRGQSTPTTSYPKLLLQQKPPATT